MWHFLIRWYWKYCFMNIEAILRDHVIHVSWIFEITTRVVRGLEKYMLSLLSSELVCGGIEQRRNKNYRVVFIMVWLDWRVRSHNSLCICKPSAMEGETTLDECIASAFSIMIWHFSIIIGEILCHIIYAGRSINYY